MNIKLEEFKMNVATILLFLSFSPLFSQNKIHRDSIIVLQSDELELYNFKNKDDVASIKAETKNYHIINFDTSEIILLYRMKGKQWQRKTFKFYSTLESKETIEFNLGGTFPSNVRMDINPFNGIVYPVGANELLTFVNLMKVNNEDFSKLGLYQWKDSNADAIPAWKIAREKKYRKKR